MSIGMFLSLTGIALSLAALVPALRPTLRKKPEVMSDSYLREHGLWDECDGTPMNKYAEEFERRHGIDAATKGQQ